MIVQLGTGSNPFRGLGNGIKWTAIDEEARLGRRPSRPSGLGGLPDASVDALWSLLEEMWAHDPAARPTASRVARLLGGITVSTSTRA